MSYSVNASTIYQNHSGSVPVAVIDVATVLAPESSLTQPEALVYCEASGTRHGGVGGNKCWQRGMCPLSGGSLRPLFLRSSVDASERTDEVGALSSIRRAIYRCQYIDIPRDPAGRVILRTVDREKGI